jgi:hypothetical protein
MHGYAPRKSDDLQTPYSRLTAPPEKYAILTAMKLLQRLFAMVCILVAPAANAAEPAQVSAPGKPAADEFRLSYPKKDHLTARQLYELGNPAGVIDKVIGQFVLLDVVVEIARDVPLVDIVMPEELASGSTPPHHAIPAHLKNAASHFSSCEKGQRLRIEGIIVHQGYGAYMIYLHKVQRIK